MRFASVVRAGSLLILSAFALAACGVDGPPERPYPQVKQQVGVSVAGDARIGVKAKL